MKIAFSTLQLRFRQSIETIEFGNISFFYGPMGAGKSTIAKVADYCLGGHLDLSPAMQSEFLSAALELKVEKNTLVLAREIGSSQVMASWSSDNKTWSQVAIPARTASGIVLLGTNVEVVSDLIFHLAGLEPPRVRRSKTREDSELQRLSLRNLLWYCYLDQDEIDSTFFHLDGGFQKSLPSRDVLRFVLGYYQERVAELERNLEEVRAQRRSLMNAAQVLSELLEESGVPRIELLDAQIAEERSRVDALNHQIDDARTRSREGIPHEIELLRARLRRLADELSAAQSTSMTLVRGLENDERHRNELLTLTLRLRTSVDAARALEGLPFKSCPRCEQELPSRGAVLCGVCGQPEPPVAVQDAEYLEADMAARLSDLEDSVSLRRQQLSRLDRRIDELSREKRVRDDELVRALHDYDTAFLASTLALERGRAEALAAVDQALRFREMRLRLDALRTRFQELEAKSDDLKELLRAAREKAEADSRNLRLLADLFLDCLVHAGLPGFSRVDDVKIEGPTFLPEVSAPGTAAMLVSSFANLSSGGKKTLFKACFAVALHRLARRTGAALPRLLIIDTPMKNISERFNRSQFAGFYTMLYELAADELAGTQMILIDKEYFPPPEYLGIKITSRKMTPDDPSAPPLISYYRGH